MVKDTELEHISQEVIYHMRKWQQKSIDLRVTHHHNKVYSELAQWVQAVEQLDKILNW